MATIIIPLPDANDEAGVGPDESPLYTFPLWGRSVFAYVVGGFARCFASHRFVFVLAPEASGEAQSFAIDECSRLGVNRAQVIPCSAPSGTIDQLITALRVAGVASQESIVVADADTLRPGFRIDSRSLGSVGDAFVEVVPRVAASPAGVQLDEQGSRVLRISASDSDSSLSATGLYGFASRVVFEHAVAMSRETVVGEQAPLVGVISALLARGAPVRPLVADPTSRLACGSAGAYDSLRTQQPPLLLPDHGIWPQRRVG
ncbi:MAG: hypothetical protein B7733_21470 [Myxococcales bacterium FL481]|nr:MAG: hypothetical protein B7733_21470 [Myxococcales bacterium FL481]